MHSRLPPPSARVRNPFVPLEAPAGRSLDAESGQTMVETALILTFISIAAVGALILLGPAVLDLYNQVVAAW